jgi:transglutaminase-like putative cysteine protease
MRTGVSPAPPRLLTVCHITKYRYACPVKLGEHQMMFRPRESHDLRLVRTRLNIVPQPRSLRWLHDVFDNSLAIATFDTETPELVFDSEVTLEHIETPHPDYALAEDAQNYPFAYSREERLDLVRALERHHPAGEVDRWAAGFLPPGGRIGTMALLRKMTLGIREQLRYSRRLERGVQTPAETLAKGTGTCRDYAFLMMEGVRSLGLAARFVSGYIFVPGLEVDPVIGGGATHAWLQVYLPGAGWVDFDPTNSIVGNRNLIRVAVAWAPAQALPLWGTFTGPASCFLGMDVSVSVKDEAQPSIPPAAPKQ